MFKSTYRGFSLYPIKGIIIYYPNGRLYARADNYAEAKKLVDNAITNEVLRDKSVK